MVSKQRQGRRGVGRLLAAIIGRGRPVGELIGRARNRYTALLNRYSLTPTRDWSERDYKFWDQARAGKARGLEISGLFLRPLASKVAAWVLGMMPDWVAQSARGQAVLTDWWQVHHADILRAYEESAALGQMYAVVNADLSVTLVPPDAVEPMVDPNDFSQVIGWRIREVHQHPVNLGQTMTITDEYTRTERVHSVAKNGAVVSRETYPNVIGLLPVVPIANNRRANEVFGSPEGAATIPLLQRYGEVLESALAGNKHQGRPTPVMQFASVDEMNAFWNWGLQAGFVTRTTETLDDGTTETHYEVQFDSDKLLMLAGSKFEYAQPGAFAEDTEKLLGLLFYLFLEHSEIPEFVWGNAIASSKASADAQMPAFIRWIEKKRGEVRPWLTRISELVLAYAAVYERGVQAEVPGVRWSSLADQDGNMTLAAVKWAYSEGLLTATTALALLPLGIDAPEDEVAAAATESAEKEAARYANPARLDFEQYVKDELAKLTSGEQAA